MQNIVSSIYSYMADAHMGTFKVRKSAMESNSFIPLFTFHIFGDYVYCIIRGDVSLYKKIIVYNFLDVKAALR